MAVNQMRIVEVTYNWPAEVFIQRHVNALQDAGIPAIIIARHHAAKYSMSSSVQRASFPARIMPNFDHLSVIGKIISLKYCIHAHSQLGKRSIRDGVLLGFFRKQDPDLIHFHNASLAISMAWIPVALGIPYTLSLRGSDVQVLPLLSTDYRHELETTIAGSSGVHSVSEALWKKTATGALAEKFYKTIYTTVPIPDRSKDAVNRHADPITLITVGRLHWNKNLVNLLVAMRALIDRGMDIRLVIVGDGPEKEALTYWRDYLNLYQSVNMTGKLEYKELVNFFNDSHGYIQPSIAEGFSNATAEAMATGLPVFATDVGGTSEIIRDGENGFLLDPGRPQDWWQKLFQAQDCRLMERIGENGRQTAIKTFSASRHAAEFISFYQRALNG